MHFNRSRNRQRPSGHSRFGHSGQQYRQQPRKTNGGDVLQTHHFIRKASTAPAESVMTTNTTFHDFGLQETVTRNVDSRGYKTPSPIQEQSIPYIMQGRDVIGIANTGTGKTAAFLLPLLHKLSFDRQERVLIVTPTRELALQIKDEFNAFAVNMGIDAVLCIGGTNIHNQERQLHRHPQVIIGTPGRLKDLINRKKLHLELFKNVVLDEVDRMVDIGFIHDIRFLIAHLPEERQSLFFSATVTDKVRSLLQQFVRNPVTVSVKKEETSNNVDQDVIKVSSREEKVAILQNLLKKEGFEKVIVFGRTKWGVEKLNKMLQHSGFRTASIHGNKSQGQRQRALQQFKDRQIQVLLATDVASRGLDIDDVTHVINYDIPATYDDYVHRIGRTGRANKKGIALTFVE